MALREVAHMGARFTWTNKQLNPILCVVDRVFVSADSELWFPPCTSVAKTRIGLDHITLTLSSQKDRSRRSPRLAGCRGDIETWMASAARLRAFLRGWGNNQGREDKLRRTALVEEMVVLDEQTDSRTFYEMKWAHRCAIEDQVLAIIRTEEEYW
ncbi:hypothetical protein D1007_03406 [Hordeum vulgare]|nr:hypothetical protein D1007_03406 [Hordeum vulgare]